MQLTSISFSNIPCIAFVLSFLVLLVVLQSSELASPLSEDERIICKRITIIPTLPKYNGLVDIGNNSHIDNIKSIGNASIDPCLWGIQRISDRELVQGETRMIIANNTLHVKSIFKMDSINMKPWQVVGYNEIIYGMKPWGMPPYHRIPSLFKLPMKIAKITGYKHIYLDIDYEVEKANVGVDLSYDIWIKKSMKTDGVRCGDLELMIWLYHKNARPAGKIIGSMHTWAYINNSLVRAKWTVYLYPEMSGGWTYIALVLDQPVRKGNVMIDLVEIFKYVSQIINKLGKNLENMYLMDIELGTEIFFGRNIDIEWHISSYSITVCTGQWRHTTMHQAISSNVNTNVSNTTSVLITEINKMAKRQINNATSILTAALAFIVIIAVIILVYRSIRRKSIET